jgi:hypothetical protein
MKSVKALSLRGLMLVITLGCIGLGITVDRARRRAKSSTSSNALGGYVRYDDESEVVRSIALANGGTFDLVRIDRSDPESAWPPWLLAAVSRDFFHKVEAAHLWTEPTDVDTREIVNSLPQLKKLVLHGDAAPEAVKAARASYPIVRRRRPAALASQHVSREAAMPRPQGASPSIGHSCLVIRHSFDI